MIQKSFDKLIDFIFIRYKGTLIERSGENFIYGGKIFQTLSDAQNAVDELRKDFEMIIKRSQ